MSKLFTKRNYDIEYGVDLISSFIKLTNDKHRDGIILRFHLVYKRIYEDALLNFNKSNNMQKYMACTIGTWQNNNVYILYPDNTDDIDGDADADNDADNTDGEFKISRGFAKKNDKILIDNLTKGDVIDILDQLYDVS